MLHGSKKKKRLNVSALFNNSSVERKTEPKQRETDGRNDRGKRSFRCQPHSTAVLFALHDQIKTDPEACFFNLWVLVRSSHGGMSQTLNTPACSETRPSSPALTRTDRRPSSRPSTPRVSTLKWWWRVRCESSRSPAEPAQPAETSNLLSSTLDSGFPPLGSKSSL